MTMKSRKSKKPIVLSKAEIARITAQQEKEFPGDPALQWVHIARKIIAKKAKLAGMTFGEYIRSQRKRTTKSTP
jgi:hypothetical protein